MIYCQISVTPETCVLTDASPFAADHSIHLFDLCAIHAAVVWTASTRLNIGIAVHALEQRESAAGNASKEDVD